MTTNADVIIIGAGGGGPVAAKELGEKGIKVLLLEAGPWYGNKKWPHPNQERGAQSDSNPDNLSNRILQNCFTDYESDMNDTVAGKFRWGSADRSRAPWFRDIPQGGFAWQISGVGGTTLHYLANSPRALPLAVDGAWPISYRELIPYYEKVEATLPVSVAPITTKEELFFYGAKKAGWTLLKTHDIITPGYQPQPNAILPPDPDINNPDFTFDGNNPGCTLRGHCINGCNIGPTVEKVAKRSTLVSYIPLALKTGNVEVRPNTFVTKVLTENVKEGLRAVGIKYKDTWTGETGELRAKVVVLAAGSIETPRLWLNSMLPGNPWVGKGLTNHWNDIVSGIFDEKTLMNIVEVPSTEPWIGQTSAARFVYPGLGIIEGLGLSPGFHSSLLYTLGKKYNFLRKPEPNEPWDMKGRVVGQELKKYMLEYPRTLNMLILTDDEVNQKNGVDLNPILKDEHGSIPVIKYKPSKNDKEKRDRLALIAADMLKKAGAKKILRSDALPNLYAHIHSTMRIGFVVDTNCEAFQVKRLFLADSSVLYNSLGGSNPTLTTQALAVRTAENLAKKYFG
ncbi:FAD-binding protein [Anaerocolumna sedimenticola]|uniref:FAD-binding protein n=1 Tax=Anaerocolumna sedimenticola TaxID=2696063 RepID=A0A6P1TSX1_9FIRM|nr:GMC family oxidoreductase [Anaerocolumna sedimenticola]QHQ63372.1 FAD-binding protein [Anaerocolumna sedimenticola]